MNLIKRIFCIHYYEYEIDYRGRFVRDYRGRFVRECRKCGKVKKI